MPTCSRFGIGSLSLLFALLFTAPARAQVCPSMTLDSQADVDAFDCSEVAGSLYIGDVLGDDITDLSPLSKLTTVGDFLDISFNRVLESLTGLENLSTVGGGLVFTGNSELRSLTALQSLTSAESIQLLNNLSLESLTGLEGITSTNSGIVLLNNPVLASLTGLENVTAIGDNLLIEGNISLSSIASLRNVTSVGGDLRVRDNEALEDCACGLAGLISGDPPAFTEVGGTININNNASGGQCNSQKDVLMASCVPPVANEATSDTPGVFALGAPYPNPFRPSAEPAHFTFRLSTAGPVRITVYDVTGRAVANLMDEHLAPGPYEIMWQGIGDDGRALPTGTYLVRMDAGSFRQTRRVTLVR